MSAQDRGWNSGWPNCQQEKMRPLAVRGTSFPGGVHYALLELLELLLEETERRGYRLHKDWCWGFGCRAIKGTSTPSNHSWGLAVDVNAPLNYIGSPTHTIPSWMVSLFKGYMFEWGGNWTKRDWMHFEFIGTPEDARRMTEKARREFSGPSPEEEDEMAYKEFKDGWRAYRAGEEEPVKAGDKKFGWNAAAFAARNPKGGAAGPHEHPHTHRVPSTKREVDA